MNSSTIQTPPLMAPPLISAPVRPSCRFRKRYLALVLLLLALFSFPLVCAIGVTGYLRLSSDTGALRDSFMTGSHAQWQKKFAAHVGGMTFALVRAVCQFLPLPPEPRAAVNALHGAEAGVYELPQSSGSANPSAILARADQVMTGRGWLRIVAVAHEHELVAIYIPSKGVTSKRMTCCLAVLNDRELVVVSARANLDPLLQLAAARLAEAHPWRGGPSFSGFTTPSFPRLPVPPSPPTAAKPALQPYS